MAPNFRLAVRRALLILSATLPLLAATAACDHLPASAVVVVVASATSNEPAPTLAVQDLAKLRQAASASNSVAYVVDTNTGQPTQVLLTPRRLDGQIDYGPDRDTRISENVSHVQQLVSEQAADGPFDLLSLLAKAIKVSSEPGTLIVLTSGLSTAGGFDLPQLGWSAQPATVAAQLKQERLLPQLAEWKVVFSGLGDIAGDQPALQLPQQSELVDYIMDICQAAGAASCNTDDVTRADPASRSTYPDTVVAVPAVTPVKGPRNATGESIPADIFFRLNSAALLPGADAYLRPIAERAIAEYARVSIQGFASPESGSPMYNRDLSTARAETIRDRMVTLGVSPDQFAQVVGEGTAGKTAAACYRNGHLDDSVCAALRYTDILLTPATSSVT